MKKILQRITRRFARDERGVHAVEFALISAMFMGASLVATDIGLAVNKRMVLDHAVRSSAQYLMQNETDVAVLEQRAREAAKVTTYSIEQTNEDLEEQITSLNVDVIKTCYCADVLQQYSCTALCPNSEIPSVYYDYTASQTYNAMYLPDFRISVAQRFQTR